MMTEGEARLTWCPFTAGPGITHRGLADEGAVFGDCSCVAAKCQVWRWEEGAFFDGNRHVMVKDMAPHGIGLARGYCGLASKP